MNPQKTLDNLLEESSATLVRQGKHNVYKLGNGRTFAAARTPSDWRSRLNDIADLRRVSGIPKTKAATIPVTTPPPAPPPPPPQIQPPIAAVAPAPPQPIPPAPTTNTLFRERLAELILAGEEEQAELMDRAAAIEQQVAFLKTIHARADDPMTEALLHLLLPPPPAPAQAAPLPVLALRPPAPAALEITRATVRAAIPKAPDPFTLNDILDLLADSARLSTHETSAAKKLISEILCRIHQLDGTLLKLKGGSRGSPTVWSRIDPATRGTRVEINNTVTTEIDPQETQTNAPAAHPNGASE